MVTFIGRTFADTWGNSNELGNLEKIIINNLLHQIEQKFPNDNNLFINTTWFFINHSNDQENQNWYAAKNYAELNKTGNLFLFSGADPAPFVDVLDQIYRVFANYKIYKIGNFESEFNWHLISVLIGDRFKKYTDDEVILKNLQYNFLSYNRKPHYHRIELFKKMQNNNLLETGLATLGKNPMPHHSMNEEDANLKLLLNENVKDYVEHGHWYNDDPKEDYGVPHDLFSLGKIDIWQSHFLNIVNETCKNDSTQEFLVTEKTLKPIIGLRPFLINGDLRCYEWLRQRGFKTFTHIFPINNIENPDVHDKIIEVLIWLKNQSKETIVQMYNDMLPDLIYNKNRFFEFAQEEKLRINNIFNGAG